MQYYYYPLCSQDFAFENVFSTESISPPTFYPKRGFGIDYFYKIPKVHHEDAIILYTAPPKYEVGVKNDAVKFILQIAETAIDINDIISINEKAIGYQRTIYLNKDNFRVLFFSQKDRKLTILRSETSLPTKNLKKYEGNIDVIAETVCRECYIDNLEALNLSSETLYNDLTVDRRYNFFKGFVYGILVGLTNIKSIEEIEIKRGLREILNSFAELKNRFENSTKDTDPNYSRGNTTNLLVYEKRLQEVVTDTERLFIKLFPDQSFSESYISKFLCKVFPNRFNSVADAQKYIDQHIVDDEIFGTSKFLKIRTFINDRIEDKDITLYFNIIREQIKVYLNSSRYSNWSKTTRENSNDKVKDILFDLNRFVERNLVNKGKNKKVELEKISFDFFKNQVRIKTPFYSFDDKTIDEVNLINNVILKYSKTGRGQAKKETILEIVKEVGNIFSKKGVSKLFQYLNNEITNYSIDSVVSIPMRNFIAVVFNPDSIEKLDDFIEAKYIQDRWMAYSFWGSLNGFANLSGEFVRPIFESSDESLQNYIDRYLQSIHKEISNDKRDLANPELGIRKGEKTKDIKASIDTSQEKILNFYNLFIAHRYNVSYEEFNILLQTDKDSFSKELKDRYNIPKKDGKKLYESVIEIINAPPLF